MGTPLAFKRQVRPGSHGTLIFGLLLAAGLSAGAQNLQYGPVFGAVTHHSARAVLATQAEAQVLLELYEEPGGQVAARAEGQSRAESFFHLTLNLEGLKPATRYAWRVVVNGQTDTVRGTLRSFPEPGSRGDYVLVTGSCQETPNMKTFDRMAEDQPWLLVHTGDYTYPDYQIQPDYSACDSLLFESYRRRYTENRMQAMLRHVPIDYIYDDNDYVGSSGGRYYKNDNGSQVRPGSARHYFRAHRFPDFWRTNCIQAYADYFPAYELPDTSVAIHHSFRFANAEFFFLDRNSAKPYPNSYAFSTNRRNTRLRFDPPADHVLYGEEQMTWLREGLKRSEADWKFVVSGVPFNPALRQLIRTGIKWQNFGWDGNSGVRIAAGFAHYWAGHPAEQDSFLAWCVREQIRDVIFISGDTHHNVLDDGRNSFYPEMNASGLSVAGTHLAVALDWVGRITRGYNFQRDVWNSGGNGLGNNNYKNAYGRIRIQGSESVTLEIVDEDGLVLGRVRVPHSGQPGYQDPVLPKSTK